MALLPDRIGAGPIDLRRWDPAFAASLRDAVTTSLAELRPWMPWAQAAPTVADYSTLLTQGDLRFETGEEWQFVLVEPGSDHVVGATGLHPRIGPGRIEVGYWVRTDATHRGYATRAARALTTAAFAHLSDIDVVEIRMDPRNHRSAAVPPRLGFVLEGEIDQDIDAPGQSGRLLVWAVHRADWPGSGAGSAPGAGHPSGR